MRKNNAILILVWVALLLMLSSNCGKCADSGWVVRSVYDNPMPGHRLRTIYWFFDLAKDPDSGSYILRVSDRDHRLENGAELFFNQQRRVILARTWRTIRGQREIDEQNFAPMTPALVRGCLAPVAWPNCQLPFILDNVPKKYRLKEWAGGAEFVKLLTVTERLISSVEAKKRGMLLASNESTGQDLVLFKISQNIGGHEEPLLLQLWVPGDVFWLYEEQGFRRSWREN